MSEKQASSIEGFSPTTVKRTGNISAFEPECIASIPTIDEDDTNIHRAVNVQNYSRPTINENMDEDRSYQPESIKTVTAVRQDKLQSISRTNSDTALPVYENIPNSESTAAEVPIVVRGPLINISVKSQKLSERESSCTDNCSNRPDVSGETSRKIVGSIIKSSKVEKNVKISKDSKQNKTDNPVSNNKTRDSAPSHIKRRFSTGSVEFLNEQIKGHVFSGWIGEREYVEKIKDYRDMIEVDEWEDSLNQKLRTVIGSVSGVREGKKWINITAPSDFSPCYCLWVLLDFPPFPGHYWFQIVDVQVDSKFGLRFFIKILRNIHEFDGESLSDREKRVRGGDMSPEEWKNLLSSIMKLNPLTALTFITPSDIGKFFKLSIILSVTIIVGLAAFMRESMSFLLRLLREFGIFVHHATPFLQSVVHFVEKLVGGFYLLIAMVYRDFRRPPPPPPVYAPSDYLPIPPPPQLNGRFQTQNENIRSVTYVAPQSWVYREE